MVAASMWKGLTQAGLKGHQLFQDSLQVCIVWAALGSAGMAHEIRVHTILPGALCTTHSSASQHTNAMLVAELSALAKSLICSVGSCCRCWAI